MKLTWELLYTMLPPQPSPSKWHIQLWLLRIPTGSFWLCLQSQKRALAKFVPPPMGQTAVHSQPIASEMAQHSLPGAETTWKGQPSLQLRDKQVVPWLLPLPRSAFLSLHVHLLTALLRNLFTETFRLRGCCQEASLRNCFSELHQFPD